MAAEYNFLGDRSHFLIAHFLTHLVLIVELVQDCEECVEERHDLLRPHLLRHAREAYGMAYNCGIRELYIFSCLT